MCDKDCMKKVPYGIRKEEIFKRVFDICFVKLTNLTDDAMTGKNQAVGEQLL